MVDPIMALMKLYADVDSGIPKVSNMTIGRTISSHLFRAFQQVDKDHGIPDSGEVPTDLYLEQWRLQVLVLAQFDIQLSRRFAPETFGVKGNSYYKFFVTVPGLAKKTSFSLLEKYGECFSQLEPLYTNLIRKPFADHAIYLNWGDKPLTDFMDPTQRRRAVERACETLVELKRRE